MAYNEKLANRVREALADMPNVEEKLMFNGLTFMLNNKMCVSVSRDELMCRIDPEKTDEVVELNGVRPMTMKGKTMPGYVYVSEESYTTKKDFDFWINLCLDYNPKAKISKKRKKA